MEEEPVRKKTKEKSFFFVHNWRAEKHHTENPSLSIHFQKKIECCLYLVFDLYKEADDGEFEEEPTGLLESEGVCAMSLAVTVGSVVDVATVTAEEVDADLAFPKNRLFFRTAPGLISEGASAGVSDLEGVVKSVSMSSCFTFRCGCDSCNSSSRGVREVCTDKTGDVL